jgi:hypothetical protein
MTDTMSSTFTGKIAVRQAGPRRIQDLSGGPSVMGRLSDAPPDHLRLTADSTAVLGPPIYRTVSAAITSPAHSQPLPAFQISRTERGVVVADRYGAAWGEGSTLSEALAAWRPDAQGVYALLVAHTGRVHRRLRPQLEFLRRYFG